MTAHPNTVTSIPEDVELTTQEAADRLNVTRPFLIRLLGDGDGQIPYRQDGAHRRIKLSDLEVFRREAERRHQDVMQELADQAQDLGLGY